MLPIAVGEFLGDFVMHDGVPVIGGIGHIRLTLQRQHILIYNRFGPAVACFVEPVGFLDIPGDARGGMLMFMR